MNDEDPINPLEVLYEAAARLSYYNAAEGQSSLDERQARAQAHARYRDARKVCDDAGIKYDLSGYLV